MNLRNNDDNESNLNLFRSGFGLNYIDNRLIIIDIKSSKTTLKMKRIQMKKKKKKECK